MSTSESSESSLASRRGGSGALGGRIEIGMAEDASVAGAGSVSVLCRVQLVESQESGGFSLFALLPV